MTHDPEMPDCFEECVNRIRNLSADMGIDVHVTVSPRPYVYVVGPYEPFISRCPHGVWYVELPTAEQTAEWARTGTS